MPIRNTLYFSLLILLLLYLPPATAAEPLIFSAAPTQNRLTAEALYQPLVSYLQAKSGQSIKLELESHFTSYTFKVRSDKYDILFDGPHFVGWRMDVKRHTPLVRLPGAIQLAVVASKRSNIGSLDDLRLGRGRVCAFPQPNMLTMIFLDQFPNPLQRPHLIRSQGFSELEQCLRSGRGDVALMPLNQWQTLANPDFISLDFPPHTYPNRTLTVSSRVDKATAESIKQALLSGEGAAVANNILTLFNAARFEEANPAEYQGLGKLLASEYGFRY
ncbi:hypothetical protein D5085_17775 [Ectothiorhodospiraceae bacterium BW-2]|nr:hypothetical protein D5085_17775 [Ectothiorhodospiraceae bacterium BW-2]